MRRDEGAPEVRALKRSRTYALASLLLWLFVSNVDVKASSAALPLSLHRAGPTLAEVQAAIEVGNRAYVRALVTQDAVAFGRLFTEDAISMPARAPMIRGRDDIVDSMRAVFAHMAFEEGSLHTITTHLEGNTATEIGSYHFAVSVAGNHRDLHGRYLVVWRRVGGAWLIAVDSSQPGAPPT